MKIPDVIYLQNFSEKASYVDESVTWCSDRINDDDLKYLFIGEEKLIWLAKWGRAWKKSAKEYRDFYKLTLETARRWQAKTFFERKQRDELAVALDEAPLPPGRFTKANAMKEWLDEYETWYRKMQIVLAEGEKDDKAR